MELKNIGLRLLNSVEKNALTLGAIAGILQDPVSDGRGLGGAIPFMIDRATHWKMPSDPIEMIKWAMGTKWYSAFKTGVTMGIAGYVLETLGVNPTVDRIASAVKDGGTGLAAGSLAGMFLWLPAVTNSPPNPNLLTGFPSGASRGQGNTTIKSALGD